MREWQSLVSDSGSPGWFSPSLRALLWLELAVSPRATHCPSLKVPVTNLMTADVIAQTLATEGVAWGGGKVPGDRDEADGGNRDLLGAASGPLFV